MSLILGIDTSTSSGSVSLLRDEVIIGVQHYNLDKSHSSLLHVMIKQLMSNVGLAMLDLTAIAIAEGPGSYTGLRIGVSAAKGLCFSLDIPLVAVNTLEAMAYKVHRYTSAPFYYCPMIDARRMEVFTMLLNEKFEIVKPTTPVILEEYRFEDVLPAHKMLFFGDGSAKARDIISHKNANFIENVVPSAEEVVLLAYKKYRQKEIENIVDFEPFYLKEFRLAVTKKTVRT